MKQQFALQPYAGMGKGRPGYRAKIVGRTKSQGRCGDVAFADGLFISPKSVKLEE